MATFKFDSKAFEKQIMKKIKKQKIELKCPKCDLYCGEYSLEELEDGGTIYCNNCDILIKPILSYE